MELGVRTSGEGVNKLFGEVGKMNSITLSQTNYVEKLKDGQYPLTRIFADDKMQSAGLAVTGYDSFDLLLNPTLLREDAVHIGFHESAHLHLQNSHLSQQNMMKEGIVSVEGFSDDFYKLMQKNGEYYISPERARKEISDDLYNYFDVSEVRRINIEAHNSYHKQPRERFSELYGIEAERMYRRATGNYSERNALILNYVVSGLPMVGEPKSVMKTEDGINLYYKADNVSSDDMLKTINDRFILADDDFKKMLNIEKTFDGSVKIEVPRGWDFRTKLNKFLATSPLLPSLSMVNVGENATTPSPSPVNHIESSPSSLASSSGVEDDKIRKDLDEVMKSRGQRFEDRLNDRGGNSFDSKKSLDVVKTKQSLAKSAKEAAKKFNDRVDDKIEEVIEKGSKALNESKIGKAYLKAEEKVLNTSVVNSIKGMWANVGEKVANSGIGKAVKKVGAKIGGKVASKVGSKTVVKSLVKKIPIVSAVAGTGFAIERCFKGEWGAAGGEFLSGIAGCFPGVGTAASVAIDVGLAANDISKGINEVEEKEKARENAIIEAKSKGELNAISEKVAQKGESLREQNLSDSNKAKDKVNKTVLTSEQIVLQQKERA